MKDRIRKKLINEKKSDQLNLLEESYITTFDSYSLSIVKKYHYLLNVSKDIKIIDDTIISNLKDKFIDEIFEELYKNEDENFLKLINDFCLKDDRNIKEMILNISKKIDLKIDKELYLRNYINEFYNDELMVRGLIAGMIGNYAGDLLESGEFHLYRGVLSPAGKEMLKYYDFAMKEVLKIGGTNPNGEPLTEEYITEQRNILLENIRQVG